MRAHVFVHLSNDLVDKVRYPFAPSELWVALGAGGTSQFSDMCIVHVNMQTQLGLGTPQTLGQYFYLPLLDWLKANLSSNLVWIGVRYFWLKLLVLVEMEESASFDSDDIFSLHAARMWSRPMLKSGGIPTHHCALNPPELRASWTGILYGFCKVTRFVFGAETGLEDRFFLFFICRAWSWLWQLLLLL